MTWRVDLARILLVRLDNLGDVVLLAPAVAAVRSRYPRARLTLLASPGGAGAAPLLPGIDEVIAHRPVWQELTPGRESAPPEHALIEDLRARQFDAAVVFTSFAQSALPAAFVCFLAGIPLRAGYGDRFAGRVLTDEVVPPSAPLHEAAAGSSHWHQSVRARAAHRSARCRTGGGRCRPGLALHE
ncbi:MAG: glycosyltransferase family 9 protein [Dehalococcoidia bacterium]